MLEAVVKQEIIFYAMGILMGIVILAKLISYITVRKMVKAASEIQKSNHRLMRLVKAKFEHASMVSDKVQNVEAFVNKYIYEYRVFRIKLCTWQGVTKNSVWVIGLLGAFAIIESYRLQGLGALTLQYIQWTTIFVLFSLLLHFVAGEEQSLQVAKNYMVEYLENVCIHRYAKETKQVLEVEEEAASQEKEAEIAEENVEERKKSEQELRIRAILEEFLA